MIREALEWNTKAAPPSSPALPAGWARLRCEALAREGADVLMLDVKEGEKADAIAARLPEGAGRVRFVACDLSRPQEAQDLARRLDGEVGGIDILVNNAAINPLKPIDTYDLAEWQRVQDVNATAAVALAQACVPSMKRKGWGQIVNICSVTLNGGWSDFTAYVGSKGTLLGPHPLDGARARQVRHPGQCRLARRHPDAARARGLGRPARELRPVPARPPGAEVPRLAPRTSPTRSCSWSPTRPASSPARTSPSTAAGGCTEELPMKITRLETVRLGEFPNILWLRVHTDEGLYGLGETFRAAAAVEAYLHESVAPLLLGTDPLAIDAHLAPALPATSASTARASRRARPRRSTSRSGTSAGKATNQPVVQLLGGRTPRAHPHLQHLRRLPLRARDAGRSRSRTGAWAASRGALRGSRRLPEPRRRARPRRCSSRASPA